MFAERITFFEALRSSELLLPGVKPAGQVFNKLSNDEKAKLGDPPKDFMLDASQPGRDIDKAADPPGGVDALGRVVHVC